MSRQVTRPSVPALIWCCVGLSVGIVAAEWLAWRMWSVGGSYPVGAGIAGLLVALAVTAVVYVRARGRGSSGAVWLLIIGIALGYGLGGVRWSAWHEAGRMLSNVETVRGTVERDPVAGMYGTQVLLAVDGAAGATVRVMMRDDAEVPRAAARLAVPGRPQPIAPEDEWARRAHRRGEVASLKVQQTIDLGWSDSLQGRAAPLRERVRALCAGVPGPGGDILQGVLIGDRSRVRGTPAEDDLRICGLSHLLAVSGTHLGILALAAGRIAAAARGSVLVRTLAVTWVAIGYVIVSGVQTSAIRAAVMGCVAGLASVSGRRGDALSALAVACGAMLCLEPSVVFDVGFQLSVSAVAGLVLFAPLAGHWLETASGGKARTVASALAATLVAQAATTPVAVPTFGMFSLVAPLANVVAVPVLTLGLAAGVLGGLTGLVVPGVGTVLLRGAAIPLHFVSAVAAFLARLPGAAIGIEAGAGPGAVVLLGMGVALWVTWPVPPSRRRAVSVAGVLLGIMVISMVGLPVVGSGASLVVMDVGQGDAILVRDGVSALLVDTGADPVVLRTALTRHGVRSLDAVLLTHDHADHTGGLSGLIGLARVARVFAPAVAEEGAFASCATSLRRLGLSETPEPLRAGDEFVVGSTQVRVLWPPGPDPALSTNDTSLIVHVQRGGFSAVLTGDAEEDALRRIVSEQRLGRIDVLKVPHHGSKNGLTPGALEVWMPAYALVSVGEGNDHGHPSSEVMEMLAGAGVETLRTDEVGDIRVTVGRTEYQIECARPMTADLTYGTIACAGMYVRWPQSPIRPERHGIGRPLRPQTRLPHPRPGRPPARTGGHTAEGAACRSRGPRLQPHRVRRGERERRRDHLGGQHTTVHV